MYIIHASYFMISAKKGSKYLRFLLKLKENTFNHKKIPGKIEFIYFYKFKNM